MRLIEAKAGALAEAIERIPRLSTEELETVEESVRQIVSDVAEGGDEALLGWVHKFDWPAPSVCALAASPAEFEEADAALDEELKAALRQAAENIWRYQERMVGETWLEEFEPGVKLGQHVAPVDRAGLYAPGGTAGYPSTVLMTAIPAKVAGVESVALASPPDKTGKLRPEILFAARLCGVDEVWKMGGAQAIAALAYGTETIRKVDTLVGPGRLAVTRAKKLVYGQVGIDGLAGPTEILIIADREAPDAFVAADVLGQAEHAPDARSTVVVTDLAQALRIEAEVGSQLGKLPRAEIAREALDRLGAIVVVASIEEACEVANALAPEHLEVLVRKPLELVPLLRHAGAIFLGDWSSESLGDYWAGPSHVLPTTATARFSSPLSAADFTRRISLIQYNKQAAQAAAQGTAAIAKAEGFDAHARAALMRLEKDQ